MNEEHRALLRQALIDLESAVISITHASISDTLHHDAEAAQQLREAAQARADERAESHTAPWVVIVNPGEPDQEIVGPFPTQDDAEEWAWDLQIQFSVTPLTIPEQENQ